MSVPGRSGSNVVIGLKCANRHALPGSLFVQSTTGQIGAASRPLPTIRVVPASEGSVLTRGFRSYGLQSRRQQERLHQHIAQHGQGAEAALLSC